MKPDLSLICLGKSENDSLEAKLSDVQILSDELSVARVLYDSGNYSLAITYYINAMKSLEKLPILDVAKLAECHKKIGDNTRTDDPVKAFGDYKRGLYLLIQVLNAVMKYDSINSDIAIGYRINVINSYLKMSTLFTEKGWKGLHNIKDAKLRRYEHGLQFFSSALTTYESLKIPTEELTQDLGETAIMWANVLMKEGDSRLNNLQIAREVFSVADKYFKKGLVDLITDNASNSIN
ncbi:MAG: hypothetical protein AABW52_04895 [Nanoarchaeota archaeon]